MTRYQEAKHLMLEEGFSCSQAVVEVFCDEFGIDRVTARKLSACLGGGLKSGEVCGFATGGLMVLGMKYAQTEAGDLERKKGCGPLSREFLNRFKEACKGYTCEELLGVNTSTPEGAEYSAKYNLHGDRCPVFLNSAIEILEDILSR